LFGRTPLEQHDLWSRHLTR